jgi:arylsulfatase A-like enzyme
MEYIKNLAFLKAIPHISTIKDDINGSYNFITSDLTHDVYAARNNGKFQNIVPTETIKKDSKEWEKLMNDTDTISSNNIKRFKNGYSAVHFFADKEALFRASKLFAWMKKNNIYDNTKIIIVSDHGQGGVYNPMFKSQKAKNDIWYGAYHPILMVKDFNSTGELKIDHTFMTIADVPSIALSVIDPQAKDKYSYDKTKGFKLYKSEKEKVFPTVFKNIFDPENWVYEK